jgi:hypothetical protein
MRLAAGERVLAIVLEGFARSVTRELQGFV